MEDVQAFVLIQTGDGKAAYVASRVDEIPGVISAYDVTGPYDVIVHAQSRTIDELGQMVVSRMQLIDGITRTLTCPVVRIENDDRSIIQIALSTGPSV
jgi:DNA-binding Lrp family transcriptional regulator